MAGGSGRVDDILGKIKDLVGVKPSEGVKNGTRAQLEKTFKEEIISLIESLTLSEREYLLEKVDRMIKRGEFDEKLKGIRERIDKQIKKEKAGELYGNKDEILKDLRENHVEVKEDVEYMGYKGKIIRITLPGVGKEYEPFEYFVSYESVRKHVFESNPELEKKSYSMKDVGGLLGAMNKYMQAMGVETDGNMDYENDLKYWKTHNNRCDAGDCLKQIAGLDDWNWLKDNYVCGEENSRVVWSCDIEKCIFYRCGFNGKAKLFLRLS